MISLKPILAGFSFPHPISSLGDKSHYNDSTVLQMYENYTLLCHLQQLTNKPNVTRGVTMSSKTRPRPHLDPKFDMKLLLNNSVLKH